MGNFPYQMKRYKGEMYCDKNKTGWEMGEMVLSEPFEFLGEE